MNVCSVCGKDRMFAVKSKRICYVCNEKQKKEKSKERRQKAREKKAVSPKVLTTQLDRVFSQFIRLKHMGPGGLVKCYTCYAEHPWKGIQCGHFQSRRYMNTRFDEGNCKPQCYACNVGKSGEQYRFGLNLDEEYGAGHAEMMERKAREIKKFEAHEMLLLIQEYTRKVEELKNEHGIWQ